MGAGFAATKPEVVPTSDANADDVRTPAPSDAWLGWAESPPQPNKRTRRVAVESGEYRESFGRKVKSPLRRASPIESYWGKSWVIRSAVHSADPR